GPASTAAVLACALLVPACASPTAPSSPAANRRARISPGRRILVAEKRQSWPASNRGSRAARSLLDQVREPAPVRVLAVGRAVRLSRRRSRARRRQRRIVSLHRRTMASAISAGRRDGGGAVDDRRLE